MFRKVNFDNLCCYYIELRGCVVAFIRSPSIDNYLIVDHPHQIHYNKEVSLNFPLYT